MEFIRSDATKRANLPFSDAVRVGDIVCLSGQMGVLPGTMTLAPGGIEAETKQMMENIAAVLAASGLSFDNVFKCTVMLADMAQWAAFNKIYLGYFKTERLPTRSAFGVKALALGGQVEMECWAARG